VSEGEAAYPGWVTTHSARGRRRVRAARVFISLEAAGAPIYSRSKRGEVRVGIGGHRGSGLGAEVGFEMGRCDRVSGM
jgi:hypothetical protein